MPHNDSWRKAWEIPEISHGVPTKWNWVVYHPERLIMGAYVDIGAFTLILAHENVLIGTDVEIGSHCAILSYSSIDGKRGRVVIGPKAKIGTHCTVMPGVTIGEGAVIGAHSFVNKDIPPRSLAYGVPACVVQTLK